MRLYKLTDENWETYNKTKWGPGVSHKTSGYGSLCGPGWLHAYTSPELAILLNPMHSAFLNPVLWEAEGVIEKTDNGLKVGTKHLTTTSLLTIPKVAPERIVRFAILCAKAVCKDKAFNIWADNWLSGADRSESAASAAASVSSAAASAVRSAEFAAEFAARSAASAARSAASAAASASSAAASAARSAASAARSAAMSAASAAASAASAAMSAARSADKTFSLQALAEQGIYGGSRGK